MKLRGLTTFALAAMLAITLTAITAHAQDLNLSDAQVFKIQSLLMSQTTKIQTLQHNVQTAQEALNSAIAKGDPEATAMAVLSLDAAEKALKNTQTASQGKLMSLLNESQKQVVRESTKPSVPVSD